MPAFFHGIVRPTAHVQPRSPSEACRDAGLRAFLRHVMCGCALVVASIVARPAVGEGIELRRLGPPPTGLAAAAFSAFEPVQGSSARAASASMRPAAAGPAAAWRPLSPAERGQLAPVDLDLDLFPHTRRAVPLLVPDAADVASSLSLSPARAMTGPSVGVRWRIPGQTP